MMQSAVMRGTELRAVPHRAGMALTRIERRVIALTASGCTLTRIAYELGMSPSTARNHREHLYEKLGAVNAPHAVAIWLGREALARLVDDTRKPD